jgi:hypothetical protein
MQFYEMYVEVCEYYKIAPIPPNEFELFQRAIRRASPDNELVTVLEYEEYASGCKLVGLVPMGAMEYRALCNTAREWARLQPKIERDFKYSDLDEAQDLATLNKALSHCSQRHAPRSIPTRRRKWWNPLTWI